MTTDNLRSYFRQLWRTSRDGDNIVGGLESVQQLMHGVSGPPYFDRVERSLQSLPPEHWDAALAVFANVVYLPGRVLGETHAHFFRHLVRRGELADSSNVTDVHLMAVDHEELVTDFFHRNQLSGRRNALQHARISTVSGLREKFSAILSPSVNVAARESLRTAASRRTWVVLSDKVLSGQAVVGDVELILYSRKILEDAGYGTSGRIVVLAQVSTDLAEHRIAEAFGSQAVDFHAAIRLGPSLRVNHRDCRLMEPSTSASVAQLCRWFDVEILSVQPEFDEQRRRSGGSLAFGYRETGITLADEENCPANSLPLLWARESKSGAINRGQIPYEPPFPRAASRSGVEDPRLSEKSLWETEIHPNRQDIVKRLRAG